jgi:hypothetical protein
MHNRSNYHFTRIDSTREHKSLFKFQSAIESDVLVMAVLGSNPLISLAVDAFKFWSLVEPKSRIRFAMVPVCIMNFFQFMYLYEMWGNLEQVIINAFLTILYFNAMVSE